MNNNFEEKILNEVTQEIETIIVKVKEEAGQANDISAINILKMVNKEIEKWCEETSHLLNNYNDKIQERIEQAKEDVTQAAKNEVAAYIAAIVTDGKGNVTERINNYVESLKEDGIDFDNNEEKNSRDTKPARNKALARELINHTPVMPKKREYKSYSSYEDDYRSGCSGGSGGCGGGGC